MPIKASNDFYTLGDIIANDQNLHGEHVNIQAVVKCVSIIYYSFEFSYSQCLITENNYIKEFDTLLHLIPDGESHIIK